MLVSIILPVYNGESTAYKCIESLINQTYKDLELIIIHNGSTDNTLSVIKRFKSKKIKLFDFSTPLGRAGAKNAGIDKVNKKSKYIIFAEADAYYDGNYVEACIKALEHRKLAGTLGLLLAWNKNTWVTKLTNAERIYAFSTRKPYGGWVFRTEQVKQIGKFKELVVGEDVEFSNRFKKFGDIDWCRETRWYHLEKDSLSKLFLENFSDGKRLIKFYKKTPLLAKKHLMKNIYIPSLIILWLLAVSISYIWIFSTLVSLPLVLRYIKFILITSEKRIPLSTSSRVIVLWAVKSFGRFFGILRSIL